MEKSRKLPRSNRETSGWDRPSSLAASTCFSPRCRMMLSILATSPALMRCPSESGSPKSANTLSLPRSLFTRFAVINLTPAIDLDEVVLRSLKSALHRFDLHLRCLNSPLGLLLEALRLSAGAADPPEPCPIVPAMHDRPEVAGTSADPYVPALEPLILSGYSAL